MVLRLWRRPAAVALIQPLAGELPYATSAALKSQKKKKKKAALDPVPEDRWRHVGVTAGKGKRDSARHKGAGSQNW